MLLGEEEYQAQNYPTKAESKIEATKKMLEGELILIDFPNLNKIFLANNKITKLIFINCPNVKEVNVFNNQIAELEVSSLEHLEYLHCGNNQLTELDDFVKQINGVYERKFEKLHDLFNVLQEMNSNKDYELEKRGRKIKELKELLGKTREEVVDYKLEAKESRLEILIEKLGVDRKQIRDLLNTYQQLIRVRMSDNQNDIDTIEDKIEAIKDNFIEGGNDIVDTQKICRKCESIAKLKVEQDRLFRERFEARQEIVLYDKNSDCNGKSTLANVLSGTEIFEESSGADSLTKEFKRIEYTIIDTPGISDTNPEDETKVYHEIIKAVYSTQKNLNQILFVTSAVTKFTTIVRTNFPKFRNLEFCEKDIKEASGKFAKVIEACDGKIIHLDNPPLDVEGDEDELELNKKKRVNSREKLLANLANCNDVYEHELPNIFDDEQERIEKLKEELSNVRNEIKKHDKNISHAISIASKFKRMGNKAKEAGEKEERQQKCLTLSQTGNAICGFAEITKKGVIS
ncbi:18149_t:CDS:2, partial [Gigaspora margarita]